MKLKPIGVIHTPFSRAEGTPIQPSRADGAEGRVEVFPRFAEGLTDVDGFDRIWLLCWFDRVGAAKLTVTPFLDDVPRGLFATRAPCRPNPIGLSCVRLLRVEKNILHVADVDMLDGTPLLDIKPYTSMMDHYEVKRCGWLDRAPGTRREADDRFAAGS
ncbi:MAG: tRNA (N6-threonylcarbamoyladenosine(37)-N6)-methyltransferase TrmO [Phycisphaerales bacterium]|nr:tRNA (N6-threonylcarbamoyladenosine(37)-N6)-methyltransferase TrmO [Phycisphaerales bacterium]